jgi:hypothetical protein
MAEVVIAENQSIKISGGAAVSVAFASHSFSVGTGEYADIFIVLDTQGFYGNSYAFTIGGVSFSIQQPALSDFVSEKFTIPSGFTCALPAASGVSVSYVIFRNSP